MYLCGPRRCTLLDILFVFPYFWSSFWYTIYFSIYLLLAYKWNTTRNFKTEWWLNLQSHLNFSFFLRIHSKWRNVTSSSGKHRRKTKDYQVDYRLWRPWPFRPFLCLTFMCTRDLTKTRQLARLKARRFHVYGHGQEDTTTSSLVVCASLKPWSKSQS